MIKSDPSVSKAEVRYPGCAVTLFRGNPTLLLNPTESMKLKLFSFQLPKAMLFLRKLSMISEFHVRQGETIPEGSEIFEYRGHKMILVNPGESPRIQFGLNKAALILSRLQAIRNFVAVYGGNVACTEFNLTPPE